MTDNFSAALGGRLRAARRQRGWSLSDVESVSDGEFKASVVGAYERGERAMSVQRLVRLSDIYGVDAAELLPLNRTRDAIVIDLEQLSSEKGDLAERLVAAIHLLRSTAGSDAIRSSDRAVLASLMEAETRVIAEKA